MGSCFSIFVYEVLVPTFFCGFSVGKRLFKTRIVSERTAVPASFTNNTGRFFARVSVYALLTVFVVYELSLPALILVIALEAVICALHPRRQTLGDLVGRTLVVRSESMSRVAA